MTFEIDLDRLLRTARWLVLLGLLSYCALQLNNIAYNTTQIFYCCATWNTEDLHMDQYTPSIHPMNQEGEHHQESTWEAEKLAAKVVLRRLDLVDLAIDEVRARITQLEAWRKRVGELR
jgi:hypothetical protein